MKKKKKTFHVHPTPWEYLKGSQRHIYLIIAIFLISGVLGFLFSPYLGFFDPMLEDLALETAGLGPGELIWFIFQNNVTVAFVGMILGLFLGVFPVVNMFINGTLVGYVYARAADILGYGVIWRLFPHGVFELPAVFIALGLGLRLGTFWFAKDKKKAFREHLSGCILVFLTVILPLLIIAAIIEGLIIAFSG